MLKVKSSWIEGVAYVKGNLQVQTKSGGNLVFLDVPKRKFRYIKELLNEGGSVGRYVSRTIKGNHRCLNLRDYPKSA